MTERRHWHAFPTSMIETVQKFDASSNGLTMDGIEKNTAYELRTEFYRFRQACMNAVRANEQDPLLMELLPILKSMFIRINPSLTKDALYDLAILKSKMSLTVNDWREL